MRKVKKSEQPKDNPVYEKPVFEKSKGMTFTAEIWEKLNGGPGCMQCSSCHGCA
ncbi:hypothetical protein GH153_00155 [bacterium]|nr:hypothetical protein [bacterium]